ncbi:MAG: hypothetical protein HFE44_13120 [Oscillospiraceae bacterium]|nr:hypothetical protein [Oscillospiraceae bacterium]
MSSNQTNHPQHTKAWSSPCDAVMLNRIYRDARIGAETIDSLLPHSSSPAMSASMIRQMYRYRGFAHMAKEQLRQKGEVPRRASPMSRASIRFGVATHTLFDNSNSHLAELVINGSTMGVIDMTKAIRSIPSGQQARNLGKELLQFEQNSIDEMKRYLH